MGRWTAGTARGHTHNGEITRTDRGKLAWLPAEKLSYGSLKRSLQEP